MTFKGFFLFLLISSMPFLLTSCCNESDQYDEGYDAAWEGDAESSPLWSNQEKIEGYQDGLYDSDMYDDGYQDGIDKKKPEYLDDWFYMDGYKDGKASRE